MIPCHAMEVFQLSGRFSWVSQTEGSLITIPGHVHNTRRGRVGTRDLKHVQKGNDGMKKCAAFEGTAVDGRNLTPVGK